MGRSRARVQGLRILFPLRWENLGSLGRGLSWPGVWAEERGGGHGAALEWSAGLLVNQHRGGKARR